MKSQAMIQKNLRTVKTNNYAFDKSDQKPQKKKPSSKKDDNLVYKSKNYYNNFANKSEIPVTHNKKQKRYNEK